MKTLKPRPPLLPAPDRPSSAPHSPPAAADASAEAAAVAPFSDPPGGLKVPSVHTQMRMHMRLNAGEAMAGGVHDRFNSQPPPKVMIPLAFDAFSSDLMRLEQVQRSGISVLNGQPPPGRRDAPDRFAM
jgi:hypothetical protein